MIEYSDHFLKEAKQLTKKYHKLKDDLKQAVHEIETQQDLGTALGVNLFKKRVRNTDAERKSIIDYLAEHPKSGVIIEGTGGIRKLRWGQGNKGKSGGVRVIYYYHDERIPLFLLTMFGKSERANISKLERNGLAELVSILVKVALENHGYV